MFYSGKISHFEYFNRDSRAHLKWLRISFACEICCCDQPKSLQIRESVITPLV